MDQMEIGTGGEATTGVSMPAMEPLPDGRAYLHRAYTAIDPADRLLTCGCGKSDCPVRTLRPIREHMAVLLRAVVSCGYENLLPGCARGEDPWPGVLYPLQMAASIEDVFADPSYVDDSLSGLFCSGAWEREEEDREQASKYVAAATVFNYVWLAYEAAIEEAGGSRFAKDKVPVRGRRLLQAEAARVDSLPLLSFHIRMARHFLGKSVELEAAIARSERDHPLTAAATAAEIGRIFRNHVVHGRDPIPIDLGPDPVPLARFYSMVKLLLLAIQGLVLVSLVDGGVSVPLSVVHDDERERAAWLISNLHLRDERWKGLDPGRDG